MTIVGIMLSIAYFLRTMGDALDQSNNGEVDDEEKDVFAMAGRSAYLEINLDTLLNNINILRKQCASHADVIAVVKANAYGHGCVGVSKFLESKGICHFAVATPEEGAQLREAGIRSYIQILGNAAPEDIPVLMEYDLVPTIADMSFLHKWKDALTSKVQHSAIGNQNGDRYQVVLKVDTGMSRNGCQPSELQHHVQYCLEHDIPVHSIMTHFSQAWDNPQFTRHQLATFMKTAGTYRDSGIRLHVSNSAAILNNYGTDLDFIRPGICMYGLPPDSSEETVERLTSLGLKPALSWKAHPTLVKQLESGRFVGYDNTYQTTSSETIATFSLGYADGYSRLLTGKAVVSPTGEGVTCPVVGRVSMDAITVKLDKHREKRTTYDIITNDNSAPNSLTQHAKHLGTISYEVATSLAPRLPRVYLSNGEIFEVIKSLVNKK